VILLRRATLEDMASRNFLSKSSISFSTGSFIWEITFIKPPKIIIYREYSVVVFLSKSRILGRFERFLKLFYNSGASCGKFSAPAGF
tara:strand:- start:166 stop:426 length:261 start_codon:yes stop_codon:yes gene_type:complete